MKLNLLSFILIYLLSVTAICTPSLSETGIITRNPKMEDDVLLTLTYEDQEKKYTLDELENLDSYSGRGGRLNVLGNIQGPFSYTGVRISKFAQEFQNVPSGYELLTVSTDGYVYKFTNDQIKGNIQVYDMNGNPVGVGGVSMVLAYKEEGFTYFYGGPLRISWISNDDFITDAPYWPKYVDEIEIAKPTSDNFPPEIFIDDPNNGLYFLDRKLITMPITIVFGGVNVDVEAFDGESGIKKVMFFIDGELKARISSLPYQWFWDEKIMGYHTISVTTYDSGGNVANDEVTVWIFNP
jgi:hypothetical protein